MSWADTSALGVLNKTTGAGEIGHPAGDLESLINRALVFDTVAAMNVAYLNVGMIVRTLGYHAKSDGGANYYEIVEGETVEADGGAYIDMDVSETQAKGLFIDGRVSLQQFGGRVDGVTDDTEAAQYALDFAEKVYIANSGQSCRIDDNLAGFYGEHRQTFNGTGKVGYVCVTLDTGTRLLSALRNIYGTNGQKIHVDGKLAAGDLSDGWFVWDQSNSDTDNDFNVIQVTGVSQGRWLKVVKERLGAINYLDNSTFATFDRGAPVDTTGSADQYVCARWRVKKTNAADAVIVNNNFPNGARLTITGGAGEFYYLRQLVPDVMRFSGRVMTAIIDIADAPAGFQYDWYILARFNSNDAERVVIIDSNQFTLPAGESVLAVTFQIPDLGTYGYTLDNKNSIEFSWRAITTQAVSAVNLDVRSMALVDGAELVKSGFGDPYRERDTALQYYEDTGLVSINGLVAGQRQRLFIPFTARKRLGANYTATVYDAAGTTGRISTYDSAGARTDNIIPTAVTNKNSGVEVIYNAPAGSHGILAGVRADSEF